MIRPASAPVRCCGQAMLAQGCRPVPAASPRAFWRGEAAGTGWQPVAGMAETHRPRSARSAPRRGAGGLGGALPPRYGRKLHATAVTGRGHLRRPRDAGAARVRLWPAMADGLARPLRAAQPRILNSEERSRGVSAPAPAAPACLRL